VGEVTSPRQRLEEGETRTIVSLVFGNPVDNTGTYRRKVQVRAFHVKRTLVPSFPPRPLPPPGNASEPDQPFLRPLVPHVPPRPLRRGLVPPPGVNPQFLLTSPTFYPILL
jgi:hypothetical protein